MIKIIKGIQVYAPKNLGLKDIVISSEKIEGIYDYVNIPEDFVKIEIIDGKGKIAFPGFIDGHVHLLGGGGEGGYHTRTPELAFSKLILGGITTVIGCLGTDGVCRSMKSLIAKVKSINEEGITAFCYTGSYDIPVKSLTDSVKGDLMLIKEIIGVGEIALSDHRSSQPRLDQFINLVAMARVGGLLSGKAGIVNVHLGNGVRRLEYLFHMVTESEIPPSQILPTHMCRSRELLEAGLKWAEIGGNIDLTTSSDPNNLEVGEVIASKGLKYLLDNNVNIENITFTSDGNGSMPIFNEDGKLSGLGICSVASLYAEVRKAILNENIDIEKAIKVITENPARILKLGNKGKIERGRDADIIIVDEKDLNIETVLAKGTFMMRDKLIIKYGTFEKI